jgi:hypothetical protein
MTNWEGPPLRMLDSQVLVHMHKGRRAMENGFTIASLSAQEFLLSYGSDLRHPRYYLPLRMGPHYCRSRYHRNATKTKRGLQ